MQSGRFQGVKGHSLHHTVNEKGAFLACFFSPHFPTRWHYKYTLLLPAVKLFYLMLENNVLEFTTWKGMFLFMFTRALPSRACVCACACVHACPREYE